MIEDDDPLEHSLRALRDVHDGRAPAVASATRRWVLERAMQRVRRGRLARLVLVPIAAVLIASTAWAMATGRARPWAESLSAWVRGSPPAEAPPERKAGGGSPVVSPSAEEESAPGLGAPAPAISAEEPPAVAAPSASAAPEVGGRTSSEGTAATPSAHVRASAEDREGELFRVAHHAHFDEHDPDAAVHAWDAYLAAYPKGRFVPEARYNRATALIRLGRDAEAREALAPFASGAYGGYRRREAQELLDAYGPVR